MESKLEEARKFYEERILGWMINDLKKSIVAEANFLTALGCLVYTEIVGIFLPPLELESGRMEQKRFYRCLFRLKSGNYLRKLDNELIKETNKGIYGHLRHNMAHKYFPVVSKKNKELFLYINSMVARDGIAEVVGRKVNSPPIFLSSKSEIVIATRNYTEELENGVKEFIQKTFEKKEKDYQKFAELGIDIVLRGR